MLTKVDIQTENFPLFYNVYKLPFFIVSVNSPKSDRWHKIPRCHFVVISSFLSVGEVPAENFTYT